MSVVNCPTLDSEETAEITLFAKSVAEYVRIVLSFSFAKPLLFKFLKIDVSSTDKLAFLFFESSRNNFSSEDN